MSNCTLSGPVNVFNVKTDHKNIGVETSFVILSCIVFEILSKTCFSVMAALITSFGTLGHAQNPAAMHFCDVQVRPFHPMRSTASALFA